MEQNHYLLLDGAQIDDLLKTIYRLNKSAEVDVLYINTRFAELQKVSPILVKVQSGEPLFHKFQQDWQQTAGIHFIAKGDIYTLGNHLRSSLQAKINNQPVIFRYYDPRILELWLETISIEQQSQFMGPITTLYIFSSKEQKQLEYYNENYLVCVTPNSIWINLNDQQLERLTLAKRVQFRQQILQDLIQYFPEKMHHLTADQQQTLINTSTERAKQYGYDSPRDIYYWSIFTLHQGINFPEGGKNFYYKEILMESKRLPEEKINDMVTLFQVSQSLLNLK